MDIFVVEDEYWALLELQTLLKKYESNHRICYFDNGEDALKQLEEKPPDLIITDITMPGMNGLELIEKVKLLDDRIECILLTVHDTFEYAKKGIQLGVADYILKPIKKEALFATIDKRLAMIAERKQEETEKQHWSINKLLFHSIEQNNFDMERFHHQPFLLIYLLVGNWKAPTTLPISIQLEELEMLLNQEEKCWLLSIDEQRKVILISNSNSRALKDFPVKDIYQYLCRFGQIHICSLLKDQNTSLSACYHEAELLMDKYKLFGDSTILCQHNRYEEKDIHHLWSNVRILENKMRDSQFASIPILINDLISLIERERMPQKQLFRFLVDMYYAIIYKIQQSTSNVIKINDINEYFDQLETFVTFDQLNNWLTNLMNKIAKITSHPHIAPKHLIPKVKEWIEESYASNITFQQFADEHHVSLSYLSREFKEQTNMTFSEYLTNVRIKKAKELFDRGMKKTVEVGALVGYNDPKHFRSVFKRVTGKTPKEYKALQTRG
ncbi:response regulator transcription factor [Gracilibacillus sp. HCP3S3_G5_1]|uniref:response regulator transcription factor n=1 Tax=unclassified Gracilibacillus TaxID=2625209 RepID=UPI003F8A066C